MRFFAAGAQDGAAGGEDARDILQMQHTGVILHQAAPKIGEHNEVLLKPLLGKAEYDKLCAAAVISTRKRK